MRSIPGMMVKQLGLAAVLSIATLWSGVSRSHDLTLGECMEGGDFIKHAAMSRDYGLSRSEFTDRLRGDLLAIQAFPPDLRWFVQDVEDEQFLTAAAEAVFDVPRLPEVHQSEFLQQCVARVGRNLQPDGAAEPAAALVEEPLR